MTSNHRAEINAAYQKKVIELHSLVVRKTAIAIDADLVLLTPVNTGRAWSNWLPSIGTPATGTVEPGNKPGIETVLTAFGPGNTIYITNNLPYIRRLNDGYSLQAPAGFVDDIVARHRRKVSEIARALDSRGFANA